MFRQWAVFSVKSRMTSAEEEPWGCHYETGPTEEAVALCGVCFLLLFSTADVRGAPAAPPHPLPLHEASSHGPSPVAIED